MSSQSAAEASGMDKPAKAVPAPRKRTAPARTAAPRRRSPKPVPSAPVATSPAEAIRGPQRKRLAIAGFGLVVVAAVGAALLLAGRQETDAPVQTAVAPAAVSAEELAAFASSNDVPVYWAGALRGRTLELTRTTTGAFVRYLPVGTAAGSSTRALTIATYPLRDAYGTAVQRAKAAAMTSRRTANGGLAVWSTKQPTSVYVAFRGVPSLLEVMHPARPRLARSRCLADSARSGSATVGR